MSGRIARMSTADTARLEAFSGGVFAIAITRPPVARTA